MIDMPLSDEVVAIRDEVARVCAQFDDIYWSHRDDDGRFPEEFYVAMARGGGLGITMPPEYGGAGYGGMAAIFVMHTVAQSGGAMAAVSTIHINLFGPHPI